VGSGVDETTGISVAAVRPRKFAGALPRA